MVSDGTTGSPLLKTPPASGWTTCTSICATRLSSARAATWRRRRRDHGIEMLSEPLDQYEFPAERGLPPVWDATRKAVEIAAPGSAQALLGSNARRVYRLEVPASAA
jgi:hypothetical protein